MRSWRGVALGLAAVAGLILPWRGTDVSRAEGGREATVVTVQALDESGKVTAEGRGIVSAPGLVATSLDLLRGAATARVSTTAGGLFSCDRVAALDAAAHLALLPMPGDFPGAVSAGRGGRPEAGSELYSPPGIAAGSPAAVSVAAVRDVPGFGRLLMLQVREEQVPLGSPLLDSEGGLSALVVFRIDTGPLFAVTAARMEAGGPEGTFPLAGGKRSHQEALVLGEALDLAGRQKEAAGLFQEAAGGRDPYAHYRLGVQMEKLNKRRQAKDSFKRAIRMDSGLVEAHLGLGGVYLALGQPRRYQRAAKSFATAARLRPDSAEARLGLCRSLVKLERYKEAAAACEAAVRLRPEWAEPRFHLGLAYLLTPDLEQARREQKRLESLDPRLAGELRKLFP